ncbi:MAG: hypothetical protein ACYC2R_15395 [Burkholderiales bacterium]
MNLKKAFEPQRRKEHKLKTMCYRNIPRHWIGEYPMDFISLLCKSGDQAAHPRLPHCFAFSPLPLWGRVGERVGVFAVNELRFLA